MSDGQDPVLGLDGRQTTRKPSVFRHTSLAMLVGFKPSSMTLQPHSDADGGGTGGGGDGAGGGLGIGDDGGDDGGDGGDGGK